MNEKPLVVIILVNYNGYVDTVECVQSIIQSDYSNYRIVIVDNASEDASTLKEDLFLNENATILYSEANDGFAAGNNIGIKVAEEYRAKYVFVLNNDTVIEKNCISKLVEGIEECRSTAIVTGTIKYYDDINRNWYCGGSYNRLTGRTCQTKYPDNTTTRNVTFASGCAMMIRLSSLQQYGLFDESYFMYSEDTDLCCRLIDNGMTIMWVPDAVIYHKVGKSIGAESQLQQYYIIRNSLRMIDKYGDNKFIGRAFWSIYCGYRILIRKYTKQIVEEAFKK